MRIQAITAVIVLAVGIMGIAPAQQSGQLSKNRDSECANQDLLARYVVSAIRFEGDGPRPGENVRKALLSRVGQPLDLARLGTDISMLVRTKWYSSVAVYYNESPRKSGSVVLTFFTHAKRRQP